MLPSSRDSSLKLLVLFLVCGAVYMSEIDVTFNVLDLSVIDIYWCIVFLLSSSNSCSIYCSSRVVLAHMSMSSAKRR